MRYELAVPAIELANSPVSTRPGKAQGVGAKEGVADGVRGRVIVDRTLLDPRGVWVGGMDLLVGVLDLVGTAEGEAAPTVVWRRSGAAQAASAPSNDENTSTETKYKASWASEERVKQVIGDTPWGVEPISGPTVAKSRQSIQQ